MKLPKVRMPDAAGNAGSLAIPDGRHACVNRMLARIAIQGMLFSTTQSGHPAPHSGTGTQQSVNRPLPPFHC